LYIAGEGETGKNVANDRVRAASSKGGRDVRRGTKRKAVSTPSRAPNVINWEGDRFRNKTETPNNKTRHTPQAAGIETDQCSLQAGGLWALQAYKMLKSCWIVSIK